MNGGGIRMKKWIGIGLVLVGLGSIAQAADTVLLTDDFNDAALDSSKWTVVKATGSGFVSGAGSTLVESGGSMNISQAATDAGGAYRTALLSVNDRGLVTVIRRTQVHYANTYVSMSENLMSESGSTLMSWGYFNYSYNGTDRYGFGGTYDTRVDGVWDTWFDETITYNPLTGEGSYSLNGGTPVTITGAVMPAGTTNLYLQGGAYGWSTGHTKQFDSFAVSQAEVSTNQALLTVVSAQGLPDPSEGSALYSIGSVVTCSVENVTSGGIRYECIGWTGTGSVPVSGATNNVVVTLSEDSTIVWNWQALDAVLTVSSSQGSPSPAVGDTVFSIGSVVTCSVGNVISEDTRQLCSGWSGSGSVPASGSSTQVVVTVSENSSLTWNWQAEYLLDVTVVGEGSVSPTNGFYAENSVLTLIATPADGWEFEEWTGDVSGSGDVAVTMTSPKEVTAVFSWPSAVINVSAAQVEGSRTVEITYDMTGTAQMLVDLDIFQDGSNLNAQTLSGALGMMSSGTNKVITWNAGTDWNHQVGELTFNLLTEDGLPFHVPYDLDAPSLVPRTGQTTSYTTADGEDGDLQPGMLWPEPRFTDNGDNTVTDNLTGLMWAKGYSSLPWNNAMQSCDNSTLAGYTDWRLPNVREMRSLFSNFSRYNPVLELNVFNLNPNYSFWTSTALERYPTEKYVVHSGSGSVAPNAIYNSYQAYYYTYGYLPVRGSATGLVHVAKTGQTNSFSSGYTSEDGDLQLGAAWPEPRFADHGDGTATDNLTGLMWTTNATIQATWNNALSTCNSMTVGGHNDWRLPSVLELESLIDFSQKYPMALLSDGHPFVGVVPNGSANNDYWASTTYPGNSGYAYLVSFYAGRTYYQSKGGSARVLACRGGVEIKETIDYPTAVAALPETGQTNSYYVGDDGEIQAGTVEPSPRFQVYGSYHFQDNLSGLQWLRTPASQAAYNWQTSLGYAESFSVLYTDWRMPNIRELESLVVYGKTNPAHLAPFQSVSNQVFWSSTTYAGDTAKALVLNMDSGTVQLKPKIEATQMLLVRGASSVVAKTGQKVSYYSGDDGAYSSGNWGAAVSDRFVDHDNGLVSDKLTGLTWFKDPSQIAPDPTYWEAALDTCNAIDFAGFDDWRLPNENELKSMIDYGRWNDALPAGHPFENVKTDFGGYYYWTSTTSAADTNDAIIVEFGSGGIGPLGKSWSGFSYVWPVRGGN